VDAVVRIVRRHQVLRTALVNRNGAPEALMMPAPGSLIQWIDLRAEPDSRKFGLLAETIHRELGNPFDLASGKLIRAVLVETGEMQNTLILVVHHIAADAWSLGVLVREIGVLYASFTGNRPSPLPELHLQYADYAAWQKDWLSERLDECL
jgi:hypothetical protein